MISMNQINGPEKHSDADKKRKIRNDLILISVLIAILAIAGLMFMLLRVEGDVVVVEVNGERCGSYALSIDRTVEIRTGEDGEELNLLVIKDGKAYVESATCPDGICAAHRPISKSGESIICLPHKVVITVVKLSSGVIEPDVIA